MMERSTSQKGRQYEEQVVEYLKKRHYQIAERNFRCRHGEIDIIARKEKDYYFIEVKGQKQDWQAELKINAEKKARLIGASKEYIYQHRLWQDYSFHYDVVIVTACNILYYEDAFEV